MDVAASTPVVSVPVLSKAAALQAASASSTLPPVTRMPLHRPQGRPFCAGASWSLFFTSSLRKCTRPTKGR